jgi:hypothetical protein
VHDIQQQNGWHLSRERERRSKARFPIALGVRYVGRVDPAVGAGVTRNVSSSGALIMSQRAISLGAQIELFVDWPILLDGTTPLQLVAAGHVVRSDAGVFALSFERYEFRLAKKKPESVSEDKGHR